MVKTTADQQCFLGGPAGAPAIQESAGKLMPNR